MPDRLKNKVAVVTGASSGIGASVARLFLEEGASVLLVDITPPTDPALRETLSAVADRAFFVPGDVSVEDDVAKGFSEAAARWGSVNAAVACAGISIPGNAVTTTASNWDRVMAVNAKGVFLVSKFAVPQMLAAGGGSIVNISSVYAMIGAAEAAAYCASKGAVRAFTKSMAIQHARDGIRVNSVHPGLIQTPLIDRAVSEAEDPAVMQAMLVAQQPNGFAGDPDDIGWGCVYLASDESRFVSGAEIVIDYGMIAR